MSTNNPTSELVELSIPVRADLVVLARLTAATVASRAGFGVDEIEDLRLAVEELCLSVVDGDDGGRLHLTYAARRGRRPYHLCLRARGGPPTQRCR